MKEKRFGFQTRHVVIFTSLLLVINIVLGVVLVKQSRAAVRGVINERMLGVAQTACAFLDGDELAALTEDDIEARERIAAQLNRFSETLNFEFIYVVRPDEDGGCYFVVDPDPDDPADWGEEIVGSPALTAAIQGEASVDSAAVGDQWGKFYTAYCPAMTSDGKVGGIVGVDFDAAWYEGLLTQSTVYILIADVLALLAGGGAALLMTMRLRRRFARLHEETTSIASDVGMLMDEIRTESGYTVIEPEADPLVGVEDAMGRPKRSDPDGIEKLSREVKAIRLNLQRYMAYVHAQAYTDGMTGVGNKTAYLQLVHEMNDRIVNGGVVFSVVVCDVNGLKMVNDEYGHEEGDRLLIGTATCLRNVFGAQQVFRIGGDEFIAVLPDYTVEHVFDAYTRLDAEVARYNAALATGNHVPITFSRGEATYRPGIDREFREVFRRADKKLYLDKAAYYQKRGGRRAEDPRID